VLVRINGTTLEGMLKANAEIAVRIMRKLSRRTRQEGARRPEPGTGGFPHTPEDRRRRAPPPRPRPRSSSVTPDGSKRFPIHEGDTIIGAPIPDRSMADVDLPSSTRNAPSRGATRLYRIGEAEYLMEEIGVVNGTFCEQRQARDGKPVAVRHGDLVGFGLVILTFETVVGRKPASAAGVPPPGCRCAIPQGGSRAWVPFARRVWPPRGS
jgi:hypothetical protein